MCSASKVGRASGIGAEVRAFPKVRVFSILGDILPPNDEDTTVPVSTLPFAPLPVWRRHHGFGGLYKNINFTPGENRKKSVCINLQLQQPAQLPAPAADVGMDVDS